MGWASAGRIFDLVAHALIEADASDELLGKVSYTLAKSLTDEDWDTVDESIDEFRDHPAVVAALRRADGWHDIDDYGTAVIDYVQAADEWTLTVDGKETGRSPGTAEGHDRLVRLWFTAGEDTAARREEMTRALLAPEGESA